MKDLSHIIFGILLGILIIFVPACADPNATRKVEIIVTPSPEARKELNMLYNPVYDDVCYYVDGIQDLECLSVN